MLQLPLAQEALRTSEKMEKMATEFKDRNNFLVLGRGHQTADRSGLRRCIGWGWGMSHTRDIQSLFLLVFPNSISGALLFGEYPDPEIYKPQCRICCNPHFSMLGFVDIPPGNFTVHPRNCQGPAQEAPRPQYCHLSKPKGGARCCHCQSSQLSLVSPTVGSIAPSGPAGNLHGGGAQPQGGGNGALGGHPPRRAEAWAPGPRG